MSRTALTTFICCSFSPDRLRVHITVLVKVEMLGLGGENEVTLTRGVLLGEALDGLVAECPGLLLVDGRLEGGQDVLKRETAILIEAALDDPRQTARRV